MVLQAIYLQPDGTTRTRTYRDLKPWDKTEMTSNFHKQNDMYEAGKLVQLKGKKRIVVAQFGREF